MIKVRTRVTGTRRLQRRLRIVARKVKNPRLANRSVSIWLERWVNDNFKSEGGEVGGWKPFKYGGRRKKGGGIDSTAELLQDTGKLRASFRAFHSRTIAGIGSDVSYGKFHELGLPTRGLPRRRMLPLNTDRDVIQGATKIYQHYIRRALR